MMMTYATLAIGLDAWLIGQWVFNLIITVGLAYVAAKNRQIDQLSERLEQTTDRRIEEKFGALSREVGLHMGPLLQRIDDVCDRLRTGDGSLKELNERDHEVELKSIQRIEQVRQYIIETCASKEDLRNVRDELHALNSRMQEMLRKRC